MALGGKLHDWLSDFLQNRTQRVVLEGSVSSTADVTSGVPQGSVIGPLLFLLFINDLPEYLSSNCTARLFADDCMVYRTIKTEADAHNLQQDLDALQRWEGEWLMQFNPSKCQALRITNKRKPIVRSYNIHGQTLVNTDTAKYLGIHIHKNLNWNHHISQVTKKANSTSAFLQRNIYPCPRKIKVLCYLTLLRPIMEYASIIWDPHTHANINRLEMVQRRYARFVFHDYQRTSSVTEMLNKLGWPTLQERRAQAKVYMMYSIKNSFVDIPSSILPAPLNTCTRRGHSQMLYIPHARTLTYQRSFIPDAARLWNSLPDGTINCTSPLNFKEEVQHLQLR